MAVLLVTSLGEVFYIPTTSALKGPISTLFHAFCELGRKKTGSRMKRAHIYRTLLKSLGQAPEETPFSSPFSSSLLIGL